MKLMKRIDAYVLKNFLTLFFATFFISSLILIMQFLWLQIDDIVGKGVPFWAILEFFGYAMLSLFPMALPLAILLASLMSFGNMGERLELLAMKSAGISLFRIMRSLSCFIAGIVILAFLFSNYIIPVAQTRMWALLFSIRQKSPEVSIPIGEFYSGVNGMKFYVRSKDKDTGGLIDVMVYDFSQGFINASVTTADTVYVRMTEDKMNIKLIFINGETFENMRSDQNFQTNGVPYRRETFRRRELLIAFDANFNVLDEEFLESQHVAKDVARLNEDIDSISVVQDSLRSNYADILVNKRIIARVYNRIDSSDLVTIQGKLDADSLFFSQPMPMMKSIATSLNNTISTELAETTYQTAIITDADSYYIRHAIEWHRKFTLSFACLIFFFIGAPLGAIIRKGGLGTPIVISVCLFIVYYIVDTTGIKMAQEMVLPVWVGLWLSSAVLLPIGIFLTYKAAKDSALFNTDAYKLFFSRIFGFVKIKLLSKIRFQKYSK
ncbi:MAG: LptF/LptG family permease [bacterium]|nr:LptF/LptG family permease [Candidatus Minthenecus merdequi]